MKKFQATFKSCSSKEHNFDGKNVVVLADDEKTAREKAVAKFFGKNCFWWADNGLGHDYGQVCEPLPARLGNGNNCVTSRIRIDVEPVAKR